MTEVNLERYKETLTRFLEDYAHYIDTRYPVQKSEHRTSLQRRTTLINQIVDHVHQTSGFMLGDRVISFQETLGFTLMWNACDNQSWDTATQYVIRIINEAIGSIESNTLISDEIEPVILIKDEVLRKRCFDLLQAAGNFDRAINQATLVLEARLRDSVPYDTLCKVIPEDRDRVGESLANKLLSPSKPVVVVSDKPTERAAFHKVVVGIIAYFRNPSHHFLDDKTKRK